MADRDLERDEWPAEGDAVVYRSHPGAAPEDGVVTGRSPNRDLVFVRYAGQHPGANGKVTAIAMLEPL